MQYATLQYVADIPLPEDELNAIEVLAGYGLEVVRVDKVGGTNYWYIKVAGQEKTHAAPGRYMDWNEGTLEITSVDAETGHAAVAAARSAQCLGTRALTRQPNNTRRQA